MSTIEKKFHIERDSASIVRIDTNALRNELPAGIYSVDFHPMMGFSLSRRNDFFEIPVKVFGDVQRKVDRLMKRYTANGEISALLSGAKGSGKTLLAHIFCNEAIKNGKAVILVDQDFDNPIGLKEFLCDVGDAVYIFDEFAKTFSTESQKAMLDFFSGSNYSKRATFVIENRWSDINEFMLDRPGRIRFHFKYDKLSMAVVVEVCQHYKLSLETTRMIVNYAARSYTIGMDTLSRIIEECIMDDIQTKVDFDALVEDLNIPTNYEIEYKITDIVFNGKHFSPLGLNSLSPRANHLSGDFSGAENHPLVKELLLVAETNDKIRAVVDNAKYEKTDDDDNVIGFDYCWYDLNIRCNRPTFSMNGELTFIDRNTGIVFTVMEDRGDELGDIERLLV